MQLPGVSGPQASDSVFDFLYHDPLRIASFLGQFDPSGVAQSLKRTDQATQSSADNTNDHLKVTVGILSGQRGDQSATVEGTQHGSERTYDPLWSNARAFLDYLEHGDMIQRDVYAARIGQFVLFTGELKIADIAMLKGAWTLPTFRQAAGIGPTPSRPHKGPPNNVEFAFEMLGILPHSIQASVTSASASAWATLQEDCLATTPGNLLLKHGLVISGEWSMLGIVDAQPDLVLNDQETDFEGGVQMAAKLMELFAPIARNLLGRPTDAFGITPLMIFREVNG